MGSLLLGNLGVADVVETEVGIGEFLKRQRIAFGLAVTRLLAEQDAQLVFFVERLVVAQRIGNLVGIRLAVADAALDARIFGVGQIVGRILIGERLVLGIVPRIAAGRAPGKIFEEVELQTCVDVERTAAFYRLGGQRLHDGVQSAERIVVGTVVEERLLVEQVILGEHRTAMQGRHQDVAQTETRAFHFLVVEARIEVETHAFPQLRLHLGADGILIGALGHRQTVLAVVVVAQHDLRLIGAGHDVDVVALGQGVTAENLLLPVDAAGVAVTLGDARIDAGAELGAVGGQSVIEDGGIAGPLVVQGHQLVLVLDVIFDVGNHVDAVGQRVEREIGVVRDLGLALLGGLGGNEDDTVRTARTVDGGCRRVLEHVDGLDVVDVDVLQGVAHFETVDDVKGLGRTRDGGTATDRNLRRSARGAAGGDDVHTGRLALQGLRGGHDRNGGQFLTRNGDRRTGYVLTLDLGVTDGHDLLHHHGGVFQRKVIDVSPPPDRNRLLFITNELRRDSACIGRDTQRVAAVGIGRRTGQRDIDLLAVRGEYRSTDDRQIVRPDDRTRDGTVLSRHDRRRHAEQCGQSQHCDTL